VRRRLERREASQGLRLRKIPNSARFATATAFPPHDRVTPSALREASPAEPGLTSHDGAARPALKAYREVPTTQMVNPSQLA